jgi:dTDP-glucose 4,6-dehydratase
MKYTQIFNRVLDKENHNHLKDKKFFITGGTGFLGMWLLRAIDYLNYKNNLNIKVILLTRNKNNYKKIIELKNTKCHFNFGNITDFSLEKINIDHIFHLAAETSLKKNLDYESVVDNIINGTLRIIKYANLVSPKAITYLSSGGVYGKNCINKNGWNEEDKYSPSVFDDVATYGFSKKCSEKILYEYYKSSKNLKTLNIFRAFSFGGSQFNKNSHFAYYNFIKNKALNKDIKLNSTGSSFRNYMHPLDLANWMLLSLKFKNVNLVNTGNIENNISIYNLAKKIAQYKYYDLPLVKVKKGTIKDHQNYIPNLCKSVELGLKARLSLDMQIEDSLQEYYSKNLYNNIL